jgi:selenocysteine lyase/cysteine desulfurase
VNQRPPTKPDKFLCQAHQVSVLEFTSSLDQVRAAWDPVPGYLNAATLGLPTRDVVQTMDRAVQTWARGEASAVAYDDDVARCRELFAGLVGVPTAWVATGGHASVMASLVAAALPDGAEVVVPEVDFTSVIFPFLVHADRGVRVRPVPLPGLADAIGPATTAVAFSLAQSSDGVLADADAVREAAARHGVLTFCDMTQAVGWMPCDASLFDVTMCSGYKWLCHPRGSAYLTVRPEVMDRLRPIHAGWYAGESRWDSCYGPEMLLAADARRFDVSPAWLSWAASVPAMELFASVDPAQVRAYDVGLADGLLARLDLEPRGQAVVSLPDADGSKAAALSARGAVVAGRAGRVRIGFHLWNDQADVDLAAAVLTGG